jgi:vacuolar-type H+-ATPase subunit D/Vma8
MSKSKKLSKDQLSKLKDQQKEISQLLRDVGFLETQKHGLLHKYAGVVQDVEEFKLELEKEYGSININIEDGTYTPIEDKKEESE